MNKIDSMKKYAHLKTEEDGFKLVYQGGLHDVWCNGSEHRKCNGGTAGFPKGPVYSVTKCDCAKWQ